MSSKQFSEVRVCDLSSRPVNIAIGGNISPGPDPKRAINGFVMYAFTKLAFGVYLVWALVPEHWLHGVGLEYWPKKYWALAGPVLLCVFICFKYGTYLALNLASTLPLSSRHTLTDDKALKPEQWHASAPLIQPIADLHISQVNRRLYSKTYSMKL